MKKMRKLFTALLSLMMILSLHITADAGEVTGGYTYTVRLFSGQQGTFETVNVTVVRKTGDDVQPYRLTYRNCDTIIVKGLMLGDVITYDVDTTNVNLKEADKYYVKGIRESGKDNDTIQKEESKTRASDGASAAFPVTGDADYVVGYGVLVDPVAYTVNYVDANGNELAPSRTYYGNIGDKPVVAYLYLDGWQPQAYNITGTLKENPDEDPSINAFTFVYSPVGSGGIIYNTIVLPGTVTDLGTEVIDLGGGGGGGGGAVVPPEEPLPDIPDNPIPEGPGNQNEPEGTLDIDDNDTPMGNFIQDGIDAVTDVVNDGVMLFAGIPMAARIGLLIALVTIAVVGVVSIIYFKKRKKDEQ